MQPTPVKAGLALIGETLEPHKDVCIYLTEDFHVESIEKQPCPADSLGSSSWILLPPPANAHTHLGDTAFPEYNTTESLKKLVEPPAGLKHKLLSQLENHEFVKHYKQALGQARKTGTGLIIDYREGGAEGCRLALQAYRETGPPPKLILHGRPQRGEPPEQIAANCHGFGLPSPLNYTPEQLKAIFKTAERHGMPVSAHIAETPETRRKGDLELLLEAGTPDYIVHGLHLTEEDIMTLAEKNIPIVTSPSSNLFHGIGAPKLHLLYRHGIHVALGTDNAAWNPPWPWREAWLAYLLGRREGLKTQDYAQWILRGLLIEGYRLARQQPPVIQEGKPLNAILVNGEPWITGVGDVYAALIKRVDTSSIVAYISQ